MVQWIRLAAIPVGHYQMSAATKTKVASAFNFHQYKKGTFCRTNLYYMETTDDGKTWRTAGGEKLTLPLTQVKNPALVYDYHAESVDVYLNDMQFDRQGFPVLLYVTTEYHPCYPSQNTAWGPKDCPRRWTTARWTGTKWDIRPAMASDNNFDMGSIYIEDDGTWRIIGPTETGPQPWCTGGEIAMWTIKDIGNTWKKVKQLTSNSKYNHGWVRRPVNAHPDFYAIWADGRGVDATAVTNVPTKGESRSNLYFCDKQGNVRILPREMNEDFVQPKTFSQRGEPQP